MERMFWRSLIFGTVLVGLFHFPTVADIDSIADRIDDISDIVERNDVPKPKKKPGKDKSKTKKPAKEKAPEADS